MSCSSRSHWDLPSRFLGCNFGLVFDRAIRQIPISFQVAAGDGVERTVVVIRLPDLATIGWRFAVLHQGRCGTENTEATRAAVKRDCQWGHCRAGRENLRQTLVEMRCGLQVLLEGSDCREVSTFNNNFNRQYVWFQRPSTGVSTHVQRG